MTDFELQPTVSGRLIELRPLATEDYAALYEAAKDPAIWDQHPEPDRHTPPVFRKYFDGALASGGALAVIDRKSGRIIATATCAPTRGRSRSAGPSSSEPTGAATTIVR